VVTRRLRNDAAGPNLPGETPEDLFDLARRAAWEELGLARRDIGPIWFSWFGFSRTDGLMVVAHTQTHLSRDAVSQRIADAESGFESDGIRWIRVDSDEHKELIKRTPHPGWVDFTCVVAEGAGRMWPVLTSSPARR
jgi:hypothetical protein